MLHLELDHFFILTDQPEEAGDVLVSMGFTESFSRDHKGQGTSNRRFEFANGMFEILYVRDRREAENGPAKNLNFPERVSNRGASVFGVILTRKSGSRVDMPFAGWQYQPDYFDPPNAFHIGMNSNILAEPLCIYVPFMGLVKRKEEEGSFKTISQVQIIVARGEASETLLALEGTDRLQVNMGSEHLAVMTLDEGGKGLCKDLRPTLPLIIKW